MKHQYQDGGTFTQIIQNHQPLNLQELYIFETYIQTNTIMNIFPNR